MKKFAPIGTFTLAAAMLSVGFGLNMAVQAHSGTSHNHFHSHPFHQPPTKNGAFVVGALCSGFPANSVTYVNKGIQIRAGNFNGSGNDVAGWDVFNSAPGKNPGNILPGLTNTAPSGTYTFNVSGLPSGQIDLLVSYVDQNGTYHLIPQFPIANGPVSVVVAPVGVPIAAIYFWIFNLNQSPLPVITVNNFTLDGKKLGIDTTHTDNNNPIVASFCQEF